jgi:hypothetical protein
MRRRTTCLVLVIVLVCPFASAQWIQTNGPNGGDIRCFAVSGVNLFAGTGNGVYRSTNNGIEWTAVNAGLMGNRSVNALAVSGTTLFAGSADSIFLSSDMGGTWAPVNNEFPEFRSIAALSAGKANIFAGISYGPYPGYGGVWVSTNKGTRWRGAVGFGPGGHFRALVASDTTVFIADEGGQGTAGGYVSTDNGENWTRCVLPHVADALAISGKYLFAGTYGYLILSSNNGTTWTEVNTGLTYPHVNCFALSGSNLFAGMADSGIIVSTNNGIAWTPVNSGLTDTKVQALAVVGANLFAGTYSGGVWRRALSEMIPTPVPRLLSPPDLTVFYGGPFTFRWSSVDAALLYHLQSTSDPLFRTNLFLNDSSLIDTSRWSVPTDSTLGSPTGGIYHWRLRAKTATGWSAWSPPWKYFLSPCVAAESRTLPAKPCLDQNYSNPFNPVTTIKFELPTSSVVRVSVFDMLGREVSVLVNERREAGFHEVKFDGSGLSSGMYVYRLRTGDFVAIKRMILMK